MFETFLILVIIQRDTVIIVCLFWRQQPSSGSWPPHLRGFYITHDTPQSVGLLWTSDQLSYLHTDFDILLTVHLSISILILTNLMHEIL